MGRPAKAGRAGGGRPRRLSQQSECRHGVAVLVEGSRIVLRAAGDATGEVQVLIEGHGSSLNLGFAKVRKRMVRPARQELGTGEEVLEDSLVRACLGGVPAFIQSAGHGPQDAGEVGGREVVEGLAGLLGDMATCAHLVELQQLSQNEDRRPQISQLAGGGGTC